MYDVIQGHTLEDLIVNVREAMKEDYKPIGGITVAQYYGQYFFLQSVYKIVLYPITVPPKREPNP